MPYTKKKKSTRRRTKKSRRYNFNKKALVKAKVPRSTVVFGAGLPSKCIVKHRYVETFTLTSVAGAVARHNWSCNSLYDPNATGTGHSYLYFNQLMGLYAHYTVIGAKIKLTFSPPNTAGETGLQHTVMVGVMKNDDTSTVGSISWTHAEQTGAKIKTISSHASQPVILTSNFSAKKTFGGSLLGNDNLQGNAVSSPLEQYYWTVFMQPYDIASNVAVYCMAEIEAIAVWDELKDVTGS